MYINGTIYWGKKWLTPNREWKRNKHHIPSNKTQWFEKKKVRFVSKREFLTHCIAEKLIPKGLKVTLKAATGTHDQEF